MGVQITISPVLKCVWGYDYSGLLLQVLVQHFLCIYFVVVIVGHFWYAFHICLCRFYGGVCSSDIVNFGKLILIKWLLTLVGILLSGLQHPVSYFIEL